MILDEIRVMRGPNMWSLTHKKLIVLKLDLKSYNEDLIREKSEVVRRILDPSLLPEANAESAYMAFCRLIASVATEVQPPRGLYSKVELKGESSYYVIFGYEDERAGVETAYLVCEAFEDLLQNKHSLEIDPIRKEIAALSGRSRLGPSTSSIVEAALKRNIPVKKLPGGLILFGQGKYQKRISASICESTGYISVEIAGDKELTKQLLDDALIPVPKGVLVKNEESLKEVSLELGYPLVTKPLDGHQGNGITSDITQFDTLIRGFRGAKAFSNSVIVEKHIKGADFRFLVIGYKLIAVAKRTPACVTGDGTSTVRELVDKVNSDPRRGSGHCNILTKITIDDQTLELLKLNSLSLDSVLKENECLHLKDTANLSTGGTAVDVTDEVHPENVLLAERVARIIGLDICGIDIMAPDVSSPLNKNGGAVLEVNAAPGLRMHIAPSGGSPRNVGDPVVDLMFPPGTPSRIPIVAVTGTNGKTTTSRLMAFIAGEQGYNVGFTSTDGVYINNTCVYKGDCSGPKSSEVILQEPTIDFAVLECARGGIIRSGLAFDECDIAIVTNVAADHLGLKDIYTVQDLAGVKAVVPQSVSKNGYAVLNASDDLVYQMRMKLECNVALFSIDSSNPRIKKHAAEGGTVITMDENNDLIIISNNERLRIENVVNVPLTMKGKADFMIENVMSAVLAAYLLGFSVHKIRSAINSFRPSMEQTPGRMNVFEINGVHVIVDYAHNPHGLKALAALLKKIDAPKTGIITGVGDRRDEDIIEIGRVAANMYDDIIIRMDKDTRGRPVTEIQGLIVNGLTEINPSVKHHLIPDSREALKFAISNAEKGAYVIISADDAAETIEIVKKLETEILS
jgi:cyanophycin synthetase